MDRLHNTMVKQMEEAEEDLNQETELRQTKTRKTSVSTACQTDKVSRKVSHVVRTPASQLRQVGQVAEQDTPVTRCLSHLSTGAVRGSSLEKSSCDDDGAAGKLKVVAYSFALNYGFLFSYSSPRSCQEAVSSRCAWLSE